VSVIVWTCQEELKKINCEDGGQDDEEKCVG